MQQPSLEANYVSSVIENIRLTKLEFLKHQVGHVTPGTSNGNTMINVQQAPKNVGSFPSDLALTELYIMKNNAQSQTIVSQTQVSSAHLVNN